MTKQVKTFTTGEGRVCYPHVFKANLNKLSGKEEFELTLLFPKDSEAAKQLKQAVVTAAKEKFGDNIPASFKNPIKDGNQAIDKKSGQVKTGHADHIYVKFTSTNRPNVIDEQHNEILGADQFYGGCYARVSVNVYAYDKIGKGVSFGLNHVQKLRDGEAFGMSRPSVEDAFGEPIEIMKGSENPENYSKKTKNNSDPFDSLLS